jgi:Protein of unknown function (DUF3352)
MPRFPRPPRPNLGGAGYEVRRRGRRFRYFLEDVGYAARRAPVRAGARVRDRWHEVSPNTRRRLGLLGAIVAVGLVLWLALIPNLPCQAPGGDRCAPADDAIGLVPRDAVAYVHADVNPDTDQYEAAAALAERVPTITEGVIGSLPGAGAGRIDYKRDVVPWLGGEGALAVLPAKGPPTEALLLEAANQEKALDFAKQVVGGKAKTSKRKGTEVRTGGGVAAAMVGEFLVLGPKDAVDEVIDAREGDGRSLADSKPIDEVRDALPDHRLASVYVSRDGAKDLLAGVSRFASLEAFVNFRATQGAGAALVAHDDAVEVDVHSVLDPKRQKKAPGFFGAFPPFGPTLASEASDGTLAYLGIGDPEESVKSLLAQARREAPGIVTGFKRLSAQLRSLGKVDLQKQILPLLGSEAAIDVEPSPETPKGGGGGKGGGGQDGGTESEPVPRLPGAAPGAQPPQGGTAPEGVVRPIPAPYLSFVANDIDEEKARKTLAQLQAPVGQALKPGQSVQGPVFAKREIEGVEARSLRISPTVDLTYAIFDGKLVVATDPEGVRQVKSGEGSLEGSGSFKNATEGFPDPLSALLYMNVTELIRFAEQEGLATDPGYALFADEIRKLEGFGLAVDRGEDTIDTEARLTVGD